MLAVVATDKCKTAACEPRQHEFTQKVDHTEVYCVYVY